MPKCFAIMPITTPPEMVERYGNDPQHFLHVADYLFKPAALAAGYDFVAPSVVSSDVIQAGIIRNLEESDLVLCDMSASNANVFFELGIRVALNKPVAMVVDDLTEKVPFDTGIVSFHRYYWRMDPWCLHDSVPALQKFIMTAGRQDQNSLWKYFGIRQQASVPAPGNPESAKMDMLLAEVDARRGQVKDMQGPPLITGGGSPIRRNLPRQNPEDDYYPPRTEYPQELEDYIRGLLGNGSTQAVITEIRGNKVYMSVGTGSVMPKQKKSQRGYEISSVEKRFLC